MKPLEFTSEQKDKLLEMCQVLFPDYNIFEIDEDGYILLILKECPAIHWFEFCMGTLAAKIDNLYFTHNKEKLENKDDNIRITAWIGDHIMIYGVVLILEHLNQTIIQ